MKTIRNPSRGTPAQNLILAAAILIIGAVFRRSSPAAGQWITVIGLGWYVLTALLPAGRSIRRFSGLAARQRAHLFLVGAMLVLLVRAFFVIDGGTYFIAIVLLAVDYLLLEPGRPEGDRS